jgi:membrane protease YdiL (CAAX protease family)
MKPLIGKTVYYKNGEIIMRNLPNKKKIILTLTGFLILNLYFNFTPTLLPENDLLRFIQLISFFPLAYIVARTLSDDGFDMYGVVFYKGWIRNLLLGFSIGFSLWGVLFALYFFLGKYEFIGFGPLLNSMINILVILVGFSLGSLINDMIVRGFVINQLKGKIPIPVIFIISIIIYALDDIWHAGISIQNTIFSVALGLSLTYSFIKANSIWVNTGIHFGLNVVYGLFFGVTQQIGGGIFLFKETTASGGLTYWLSSFISLMILFTLFLLRHSIVVYKHGANKSLFEKESSQTVS